MNTVVIYQSHYGFTETYAKWLAEELGCDLLPGSQVKPADLQRYDTIVYGGGLYAGSVSGVALLTKHFDLIKDKQLYLFAVGASDMTNEENIRSIRSGLEQKLPPALFEKLHIYHLRGGMLFSKLSLVHRMMMRVFLSVLAKKPEAERRADEVDLLAAASQDADFTDRAAIAPLVASVRGAALH